MFTGLIEKVGLVSGWRRSDGGSSLSVRHEPWKTPLSPGESVCVSGCCLTVTRSGESEFACDVLDETVARTNLRFKQAGAKVNLERALPADGRFGGHIVAGHIDGVGRLAAIKMAGRDHIMRVECGEDLMAGIVEKGSVACEGVSLTVSAAGKSFFEVAIVAFTWDHTSFPSLSAGDSVNVEVDIIGKFVKRYVEGLNRANSGVSTETLERAGFV